MIKKETAINALDELVSKLTPYINGLDSEEIAEIYIDIVKTLD